MAGSKDVTISNRREPTFGGAHEAAAGGAHDKPHNGPHIAPGDVLAHKVAKASGLTRMVSTAQIVGSLLAVPLGLASGYSMYKANFAVDTTCQNLRASIVAMLDKNVDAATRRMLVRRDITTFEQTCGDFDPDAHAAFKTLLAAPPAPAATATAAAPKLRSALPATEVTRKAEPKAETKEVKAEAKAEPKSEPKAETKNDTKPEPKSEPRQAAEKAPAVAPQPASIEAIEREAALSDTRWLAAVREALVTNNPEPVVKGSAPANLEVPKPARTETHVASKPTAPPVQLQPTWTVPAQAEAPATPPPAVAAAPVAAPLVAAPVPAVDVPNRVTPVHDDRPRPPAPITGPAPINGAMDNDDSAKSRIGSWIAQIPLVGRVIEPRN